MAITISEQTAAAAEGLHAIVGSRLDRVMRSAILSKMPKGDWCQQQLPEGWDAHEARDVLEILLNASLDVFAQVKVLDMDAPPGKYNYVLMVRWFDKD